MTVQIERRLSSYVTPMVVSEKLGSIEGLEVEITDARTVDTRYGQALVFHCRETQTGAVHSIITSGIVVMPALLAAMDDLPVVATFVMKGRAFTVADDDGGEPELPEHDNLPF